MVAGSAHLQDLRRDEAGRAGDLIILDARLFAASEHTQPKVAYRPRSSPRRRRRRRGLLAPRTQLDDIPAAEEDVTGLQVAVHELRQRRQQARRRYGAGSLCAFFEWIASRPRRICTNQRRMR
jgi:hypothetical protein